MVVRIKRLKSKVMYRWVVTGFIFVACVASASAQGIAARNRAETLAGLNGVHVIVEEMPAIGVEAGLTTPVIKSAVEAKLTAMGVPLLGLGQLAMDPRGPTLLLKVDIDLSDPVYFYYAQVQFFQNASMMTGDDILASTGSASTWQAGTFARIGKFRINTLPQEVNKLVSAFATDYLKHNAGESTGDEPEDGSEESEEGSDADPNSESGL